MVLYAWWHEGKVKGRYKDTSGLEPTVAELKKAGVKRIVLLGAVPYWRDRTDVYTYTEGTLNVDLVDAKQNRLVWTGVAVGRVGRTKPEERGAKIDAAVAEIFLRYPYRAGSGTPAATP